MSKSPRPVVVPEWCRDCGTLHGSVPGCPRNTEATGPEKPRWRVGVQTPEGLRGFGVLVAESGTRWRARIVTFPNILWMVPGGGETMKFLARSEEEAVRTAVTFVRQHCNARGYLMRDELEFAGPLNPIPERFDRDLPAPRAGLRRYDRRLPLRYGSSRPTIPAVTCNLSAGGLFVATRTPPPCGQLLGISLELEHCKVPLRGEVVWNRTRPAGAREAGMGLRLVQPPAIYIDYIRALA